MSSVHIAVRVPDHIIEPVDALCARIHITRTEALLNALVIMNEMYREVPQPIMEKAEHANKHRPRPHSKAHRVRQR